MNIFVDYDALIENKTMFRSKINELKEIGKVYCVKNINYSEENLLKFRMEIIKIGVVFDNEFLYSTVPKEKGRNILILNEITFVNSLCNMINFEKIILSELSGKIEKKFKKILKILELQKVGV